jgi:hypothetical protein
MPFSRVPAATVAGLEALALGTFLLGMLGQLSDLWVRCTLLVALSTAAFFLHYR